MRYFVLGCCCLLLACQPRPASETDNEFFKTEEQQLVEDSNSTNELVSLSQLLERDAKQVIRLSAAVRAKLDSFYSLPADSITLARINLLEQAYLDLASADEAFIRWKNEYAANFDSLGTIKDTANLGYVKYHIQPLFAQLRNSIQKADSLSKLQ